MRQIRFLFGLHRVLWALVFATWAHWGQKRKYTGWPYIVHPISVAWLVMLATWDVEMVMAALLHDVVEDTSVTIETIARLFRMNVAMMVDDLTDKATPEMGGRAVRKAFEADRVSRIRDKSKTIKLADLIMNTQSIVKEDPDFAVTYLDEKRVMLLGLADGDYRLLARAWVGMLAGRERLKKLGKV